MMFMLPPWYSEAREELDKCIDEVIRNNNIDWRFAHDSKSIEDAKETILMSLYTIWEKVDTEDRKRTEELQKEADEIFKVEKEELKKIRKEKKKKVK